MGRLAQGVSVIVGLLVAMVIALPTFKPVQLVEFLGITGVAIGFAFRDVLQNFLAGILLLVTEPFRIDDQIKVDDFEGTVEDIQTRATFIRTYDGRRVVIPNADLFTKSVIVNTAYPMRRIEFQLGIGFGDDIERTKQLVLDVLHRTNGILKDPAPDVIVAELAESSVNLRVRWWITPPRRSDALDAVDHIVGQLKKTLVANGIDLPFPTHQILFHDQTEETDGDRRRQREGWPAGKGEVPKPRVLLEPPLGKK
jgi:small conductance mechanosensitive channel